MSASIGDKVRIEEFSPKPKRSDGMRLLEGLPPARASACEQAGNWAFGYKRTVERVGTLYTANAFHDPARDNFIGG